MPNIGLYRVDTTAKTLTEVAETDFAALGLKERQDLQEWVLKNPSILGEELLIISKECDSFDLTAERADLVALDKSGAVVIIELKRDDSGKDVHWQAIKYASYFARATPELIIEILAKHLAVTVELATTMALQFLEQDDLSGVNRDQRILLVSHRFAREATSAVLWLRHHGADISCIQLTPYSDSTNSALYLQAAMIIPVPGAEEYVVSASSPLASVGSAAASRRGKKDDEMTAFLRRIAIDGCASLTEGLRPDKHSRWAGVSGPERYFNVLYKRAPWKPYHFQYKLHVFDEDEVRKLSVGFEFSFVSATAAGLTADQLDLLTKAMKAFAQEPRGFWEDPNKWAWCGTTFDLGTQDATLLEEASAALVETIKVMTPVVDGLTTVLNVEEE